jgi:hypothetical protein
MTIDTAMDIGLVFIIGAALDGAIGFGILFILDVVSDKEKLQSMSNMDKALLFLFVFACPPVLALSFILLFVGLSMLLASGVIPFFVGCAGLWVTFKIAQKLPW